jgi:hypothetical protein
VEEPPDFPSQLSKPHLLGAVGVLESFVNVVAGGVGGPATSVVAEGGDGKGEVKGGVTGSWRSRGVVYGDVDVGVVRVLGQSTRGVGGGKDQGYVAERDVMDGGAETKVFCGVGELCGAEEGRGGPFTNGRVNRLNDLGGHAEDSSEVVKQGEQEYISNDYPLGGGKGLLARGVGNRSLLKLPKGQSEDGIGGVFQREESPQIGVLRGVVNLGEGTAADGTAQGAKPVGREGGNEDRVQAGVVIRGKATVTDECGVLQGVMGLFAFATVVLFRGGASHAGGNESTGKAVIDVFGTDRRSIGVQTLVFIKAGEVPPPCGKDARFVLVDAAGGGGTKGSKGIGDSVECAGSVEKERNVVGHAKDFEDVGGVPGEVVQENINAEGEDKGAKGASLFGASVDAKHVLGEGERADSGNRLQLCEKCSDDVDNGGGNANVGKEGENELV